MNAIGTRTVWKRIGATLLAAGIVGCEVGPNYTPPKMAIPGEFSESSTRPTTRATTRYAAAPPTTEELKRWWGTFNDPELNRLVDRALTSNLDLQAAVQRVRQARAQLGVVRADFFPTVNANGQYSRSRRSANLGSVPISTGSGSTGTGTTGTGATGTGTTGTGTTGTGTTGTGTTGTGMGTTGTGGTSSGGTNAVSGSGANLESNFFEAGFDSTWELDIFGGVRRNIEAAQYNLEASVDDRQAVMITLLGEVATSYSQLRGLQRQMAITKENINTQQQSLDLIRTKNGAGLVPETQVAQQQAQLLTTQAQLPTLEAQIHQSIHQLGVLLGEDPGSLVAELEPEGPIPFGPSHVPPGLPSDLLRRRPDIREAERKIAAASANIGVATADLYPKFSLTGSFGEESSKFHELFNWNSRFFSIGPAVNWPIFDWGRIRSNIEVQNSLERQAFIAYEQSVLTGLQEVDDALITYTKEQDRRQILEDAVKANQRAVELTQDLYKNGLGDFLSVLTAQASLFAAEDSLAISETSVSTDLVALYKALGGGWEVYPQ